MRSQESYAALAVATVVVLSVVAGGVALGAARTGDLGDVATVDATPSDPNEAESTHAVVVPLGSAAESPGSPFRDVVVDYTVSGPEADVSNVGAGTVERVGIDRDGDDPGTRVDVRATVTTVSGKKDGAAVRIATAGDYTLQRGDEVVVVLRPVQNPQTSGTAEVAVTVNSQTAADRATGTVTYEYNDARVSFEDQSTTGDTVTVSSVNLSEGGFVAVQNASGTRPDEIRGHSDYLEAGRHTDVTVHLDAPLTEDDELVAQAYTDANADLRFEYGASGGEEDFPYRNRDGNPMGSDSAQVTHTNESGGDTPTADATPARTSTATPSDGTGDATPTPATATDTPADDGDGTTPTATPPEDDATPVIDTATDTATDGGEGTPTATDRAGAGTPTTTPTAVEDGTATPSPTPFEAATDRETPGGTTADGGQPGFGVAAALFALAGAALLARRRR